MQVKISYILSLLSGILATVSVFLTYCSVEILGYNVSSLNGFDFRDLLKDIGGNWLNGLAEYAVIFIFIFGAFTIIYSIVLFINNDIFYNEFSHIYIIQ